MPVVKMKAGGHRWRDIIVVKGTSAIVSHYHIPDDDGEESKLVGNFNVIH